MLNNIKAEIIGKSLHTILGKPSAGNMAFIRCFSPDVVKELCMNRLFTVPDWITYGVINEFDRDNRFITADHAVELREEKRDSILFIIDVEAAGAGMDGIYSASREISEAEFFKIVNEEARKRIPHGYHNFVKTAVAKARRIGGRNTISPWKEFEFYSSCSNVQEIGNALTILGLWPIKMSIKPELNDLDKSANMVERLFLFSRSNTSAETKVESLMLINPTEEQRHDLLKVIREGTSLSLSVAVMKLSDYPHLWLNILNPGVFDLENIQRIEVVSWWGKNQKLAVWSGLHYNEEYDRIEFILDPETVGTKKPSRLEVRWNAFPEDLKKGAVEYTIAVVSGEEELAEKRMTHTGNNPQKCVFTFEDFELEEGSIFEAVVRIRAVGDDNIEGVTEDFILRFGNIPGGKTPHSIGSEVRALVEGMILLEDEDSFTEACKQYNNSNVFSRDKKNFITFRYANKRAKVYCPPLLRDIEEDWGNRQGATGRWKINVRADGSRVGNPEFIPYAPNDSSVFWDRLCNASNKLSQLAQNGMGLLGLIYGFKDTFEEYVNAWISVLENGEPYLALANTVEIQSMSNTSIGIIVLPNHPLRVAWHQAYDMLLKYMKYEQGIPPKKILDVIKYIDGAHFPAFLPGIKDGESFIFGDILGFYAIAMISEKDREPKASIAILAKALTGGKEIIAPSIGSATSGILAQEVKRYVELHPQYNRIHLHALRPGDGMTVGKALGGALLDPQKSSEESDENESDVKKYLSFVLDLYPSGIHKEIVGKFFNDIIERKRTGAGNIKEKDTWVMENYNLEGNITIPKLVWIKREKSEPETSSHLSIAFDTFDSRVISDILAKEYETNIPHEVFGLVANIVRNFSFLPQPVWRTFIPPFLKGEKQGEKHPSGIGLTDRLTKIHAVVLKTTVCNIDPTKLGEYPVMMTEILPEKEESIRILHSLSDWVITIDRNAGVEYFDSPKEKSSIYDAYIIDCIPEREDLGFLQMVTSTSNFNEVVNLLDSTLGEMGLSSSPRSCLFLINELKGLSGRLAMRLVDSGNRSQEMIALALTHAQCRNQKDDQSCWKPLSEGVFVPFDDVPYILPKQNEDKGQNCRSDLLYVTVHPKGGLQFSFIEVKFRRYLQTARSQDLIENICNQILSTRQRWENLYGDNVNLLERTIRRSCLARVLKFYVNKGFRHCLKKEAYQQLIKEIDRMIRDGEKYSIQMTGGSDQFDCGYVFCPEFKSSIPTNISFIDQPNIFLFGASQLPDLKEKQSFSISDVSVQQNEENSSFSSDKTLIKEEETKNVVTDIKSKIVLGNDPTNNEQIEWLISIDSNPHLLIAGLPGMGKTTALINICKQLYEYGISPIVFSYHDDIDKKLNMLLSDHIHFVDYAGLGFNPLQVVSDSPIAYIDNVGIIRDIFSSVFPDLGELQLARLREALKKSYDDKGWGDKAVDRKSLELPGFKAFFDILKADPKQDKGLIARLGELNDYGFFNETSGAKCLLDLQKISLIRIHNTQNEVLQRAFSIFVLHNLYQGMFQRGIQKKITHAIIFDEAHRAAKLKLLPSMVKECRKYGITLIVASQEAKDFNQSLFGSIANYLVLRLTDYDAKLLAKIIASSDRVNIYADRIKKLPKYHALFLGDGKNKIAFLNLLNSLL